MYAAFAATAFQTSLAYRGRVLALVFGELVEVFAKVAIWTSLFALGGDTSGVTLAEMITYAVFGGLLSSAWYWRAFLTGLGTQIKTGDVAVFLLKPLNYPLMLFAGECGRMAFGLLTVVLPTTLLIGLSYGLVPPASPVHGALALVAFALGFAILFLLASIAGLLAFWLMTVFSLEWLLAGFMSIFSGTFVPLWFFPAPAAAVIEKLPFAYTAYHPMAIYLGKLDVDEALATLAIGVGWALVLAADAGWLWRRARRRIVVQGG